MKDRAIAIFDTFAVGQVPQFRESFHGSMPPKLKPVGKTNVVISRGDRHPDCYDIIISVDRAAATDTSMYREGSWFRSIIASGLSQQLV
jgi:ABC-type siderophore export system fused ATPase/permease subunit